MSSDNLLADRRMDFARELHARGAAGEAIELLEQALELAPSWIEAHFLLGQWLDAAGRRDAAIAAYRRCLELDRSDRMGAVLRLALLGAVAEPPALPPAYVTGVFDEYAADFESALVERLAYAVPAELHALVSMLGGPEANYARVLDLGCGTGLAGERFRAASGWLEGVDLSGGMIDMARRKSLYDRLEVGDILDYLDAATHRYDLVLAADVLVYLGDLADLLAAVFRALAPGGLFAASVEAHPGDGFCLTAGHRYAHSESYLRNAIEGAGLILEACTQIACRLEGGTPLAGYVVVARRPGMDTDAGEASILRRRPARPLNA